MKDYFSKFVWKDWLADEALRRCSFAARGLWMDMLSLMAGSCRRGFLVTKAGKPLAAKPLAEMLKEDANVVSRLLQQLENAEVFSREDDGTIYSRRMVRDEVIRERGRVYGPKGGNPTLKTSHKGGLKGGDKGCLNPSSDDNSDSDSSPPEAQKTPDAGARDDRAILALERRIGRDLTAGELRRFVGIRDTLDAEPVVVDGAAVGSDEILIAAIGCLHPKVGKPFSYLAATIDQCRADGTMPGDENGAEEHPQDVALRHLRKHSGAAP